MQHHFFKALCGAALLLAACGMPGPASNVPPTQSQGVPAMETIDLTQYQWNNRLLLIFAPSAADAAYQQQEQFFANESAALQDRDLVVGAFFADARGTHRLGTQHVSQEAAAALRQRFDVASGCFLALLVGKDGGVKERYDAPVSPANLFGTIDAMPMRQREMREER